MVQQQSPEKINNPHGEIKNPMAKKTYSKDTITLPR